MAYTRRLYFDGPGSLLQRLRVSRPDLLCLVRHGSVSCIHIHMYICVSVHIKLLNSFICCLVNQLICMPISIYVWAPLCTAIYVRFDVVGLPE